MKWQEPSYLWIELIPALLLLGWVYSEAHRLRRLRAFGDPDLLGVSGRWGPRVGALAALVSGVAFAAAVIPMPAFRVTNTPAKVPVVEILLDMESLEGMEDSGWETFDSSLQVLLGSSPSVRYSAITLGTPSEVVVYPTVDTQGLQTVLSRMRFVAVAGGKTEFRQAWEQYAASRIQGLPTSCRVIVTALPADEVERISDSMMRRAGDIVWVQISNGSEGMRFMLRDSSGSPYWTTHPMEAQRSINSSPVPPPGKSGLDATQWLALAAIVILGAENVCRSLDRSRKGRDHIA